MDHGESPDTAERSSQKRDRPTDDRHESLPDVCPRKRQRAPRDPPENTASQEVAGGGVEKPDDPLGFWARKGDWPSSGPPEYAVQDDVDRLLAKKKKSSTPSSPCSLSEPWICSTPSDQRPREEKSAPYVDPRYELLLQSKGTYMNESELDVTMSSKQLCCRLLDGKHTAPSKTLFDDDIFEAACQNLRGRNEERVIRDISRLIVPSAEILAIQGAKHLEHVVESLNEGWNKSVPLTGTRPQPDYSAGFRRGAFTKGQLDKLSPFFGDWLSDDQCYFTATYYMLFPFLTNETKCGAEGLDIADRQNAHSMTLAVRAVVELFRLVGRESEVHRELLAFAISNNEQSVRIYGYYPVIEGKETKYYCHPIRRFDITELDGKEKWTGYTFTKNVYDLWVPGHLERIRSAIDMLPSGVNFDVGPIPEGSVISQVFENQILSQSDVEPASEPGENKLDLVAP